MLHQLGPGVELITSKYTKVLPAVTRSNENSLRTGFFVVIIVYLIRKVELAVRAGSKESSIYSKHQALHGSLSRRLGIILYL